MTALVDEGFSATATATGLTTLALAAGAFDFVSVGFVPAAFAAGAFAAAGFPAGAFAAAAFATADFAVGRTPAAAARVELDFAGADFAITRSFSSAALGWFLTFAFTLTFVAPARAADLPALGVGVGAGRAAGDFFGAAGFLPAADFVPVWVLLEPDVLAVGDFFAVDDFLIPTLNPFGKSEEIEDAPPGAALLQKNRALYQLL